MLPLKSMMNLIHKLEKSKAFWSLIWLSLLFFFLRLPSLIEPNWYSDEGIYQVIGRSLAHGQLLYTEIWDNKPPLLYLIYALFNGDQFLIRVASLLFGLMTVWVFFFLSNAIFKRIKLSVITTSVFLILFAIPLTEGNIANAENFMLLPIVAAALIFYKTIHHNDHKLPGINKKLFLIGFFLGIAFLFKIVAIFDLAAFLFIIALLNFPFEKRGKWKIDHEKLKLMLGYCGFLSFGFFLPLGVTIIYFAFNQTLGDFLYAVFSRNIAYASYFNTFIIPQGFLLIKIFFLVLFLSFLVIRRSAFSPTSLFILIWLAFSLFNALFTQRPYTHYVLVLLPSFCLLIGLLFVEHNKKIRNLLMFLLAAIFVIIGWNFQSMNLPKTLLYYPNAFLFVTGNKDVLSYQTFFDRETPRDYELAAFIKMKNKPGDPIFIWGDSAQIYMLSETKPITKYTVAYHTKQNKNGIHITQEALDTIRPNYVIVLTEAPPFPFRLNGYINIFSLEKAIIYEKIL